uniref:Uncharacterized protein n=1 Tax=Arion vulgaris TaxID=1028688 RepID=A0A0B7BC26_9EUPU
MLGFNPITQVSNSQRVKIVIVHRPIISIQHLQIYTLITNFQVSFNSNYQNVKKNGTTQRQKI